MVVVIPLATSCQSPRIITHIMTRTVVKTQTKESSSIRRPSWIQRDPFSTTTAVTDPSAWPPHNPELVYDWNLPTAEFYKAEQQQQQQQLQQHHSVSLFPPAFASARQKLDYSYHHNLILTRQLLQDAILRRVVDEACACHTNHDDSRSAMQQLQACEEKSEELNIPTSVPKAQKQQRPWIVFTAGPMGVGKGYVLTQLHQQKLFPLHQFVKIDPDMIKSELPEMAGYLQSDRDSAATKLHRESTQMADVLLEHALAQQLPILVDGSLRDVDYYQQLWQRLRRDFAPYRIAILHVTASRDIILQRAADRARQTGRFVPVSVLEESLKQVPASVQRLSSLADVVHTIANHDRAPLRLVSSQIVHQHQQQPNHGMENENEEKVDHANTKQHNNWQAFGRSWLDDDTPEKDSTPEHTDGHLQDESSSASRTTTTSRSGSSSTAPFCLPPFDVHALWLCAQSHAAAHAVWSRSYPSYCPRCALACDGQCGQCRHGTHLCSCTICNPTVAQQLCGGGDADDHPDT